MASSKPTCGRTWETGKNRRLPGCFRRHFLLWILVSLLAVLLSACKPPALATLTDPEAGQVHASQVIGAVNAEQSVGQSLVSRRPRLNGITLWLSASESALLNFSLYHAPGETAPLYSAAIAVSGAQASPLRVEIPPQDDPPGQAYYLELRAARGELLAYGRLEEAYPYGQAYRNGQPIPADLAFECTYEYDLRAVLADLQSWTSQAGLLFPLFLLLVLPGWLLLQTAGLNNRQPATIRLALAIALSLAIIPLGMLWSTQLGLRWNQVGVRFAAGALSALFLLRLMTSLREAAPALPPLPALPQTVVKALVSQRRGLALALILLGSLAVRLAMVRDLATPAWVDSVHHALLTRLILENGGLPADYRPFLAIDPAGYHPGFHSLAAVFIWLSGQPIPEALLLLGQVLNALAGLAVYLLTVTLTGDRRAGLLAAFIASFLTPMPAYYASWGRYTHLAGLLILPALPALLQMLKQSETGSNRAVILLGAIALGGLLLVHYRVLAFLLCLLLAILIGSLRERQPSLRRWLGSGLVAGLLALALVLPWFLPFLKNILLPRLSSASSLNLNSVSDLFSAVPWRLLNSAYGKPALALAGLGLLYGLFQRPRFALSLGLWSGILLLLLNWESWNLPGGSLINAVSVAITLFMPTAVAGGYLLSQWSLAWEALLPKAGRTAFALIGAAALAGIGLAGARQLLPILNPITILSRAADRPALAWAAQNLPPGQTVLINPFAWGYGVYAGQDGGYWLSAEAGLPTMPPPVLYGLEYTAETRQINQLAQEVIARASDPQKLWELLQTQRIRYIFIGRRGGVLSPRLLQQSPHFSLLYAEQGVWIFQVLP